MIFEKYYNSYYSAVASIINRSLKQGGISATEIEEEARRFAPSSESAEEICRRIKGTDWPFLLEDAKPGLYRINIKNVTEVPLTSLEKSWLKALSLDPRIKLFDFDFSALKDVEPLYTDEEFRIYDRSNDGDDYNDPNYVAVFRTVQNAILNNSVINVEYISSREDLLSVTLTPVFLEYSDKDDKFRLSGYSNDGRHFFINLARIRKIELSNSDNHPVLSSSHPKEQLVFTTTEERNSLERIVLSFAHHSKDRIQGPENGLYTVTIHYDKADEAEIVMQLLAFGPCLTVLEPASVVDRIRAKLLSQYGLDKE